MKTLYQKIKAHPYTPYLFFGFMLSLIPLLIMLGLIRSSFLITFGVVIYYSIAALGLNILLGWSGLISLGTSGFMGLAAYLSAFVTINLKLPFEISLLIGVAIPVVIGAAIGLISLRIEGFYLAIATLIVSEILKSTFGKFDAFTNSFSGKRVAYPTLFGLFKLNMETTYLLMIVFLIVIMILIHNLIHSSVGRALSTMRGSEAAAQAMGIDILKYRLIAFMLATGLAAIAGVLYAHFIRYIYPSDWDMSLSLNFLAAVLIGGVRSIFGTVLGVFAVFSLSDVVFSKLPLIRSIPYFSTIINGVAIILIIILYPSGLIKMFTDLKHLFLKLRGHKA